MADAAPQPAAHEDARADTRTAAKWLIAAFAAVGAVLLSGIGLTNLGHLEDARLLLAIASFTVGVVGVLVAVYLITDVLTPSPVTLKNLADIERARNQDKITTADTELVAYIESDPVLLQGIVLSTDPPRELLINADAKYTEALDDRFRTADAYWTLAQEKGEEHPETIAAKEDAQAASNRSATMHGTVRRLERIANAQQTVFAFKARRGAVASAAISIAISIGVFAMASNPPQPSQADLRGAVLDGVDLSGTSLREVNLEGMTLRDVNFEGANLEGAKIDKTVWVETDCPDGTLSDNAGETCAGHLSPRLDPGAMP